MRKWWLDIKLENMDKEQWESVCDRCGICCLNKLQDEETDQVHYTRVSCKLFDTQKCQCMMYEKRQSIVKECVQLTYDKLVNDAQHWLPDTCGYKRLLNNKDLPEWHHLKTGSTDMMHKLQKSAKDFAISEYELGEDDYLEDFIID